MQSLQVVGWDTLRRVKMLSAGRDDKGDSRLSVLRKYFDYLIEDALIVFNTHIMCNQVYTGIYPYRQIQETDVRRLYL